MRSKVATGVAVLCLTACGTTLPPASQVAGEGADLGVAPTSTAPTTAPRQQVQAPGATPVAPGDQVGPIDPVTGPTALPTAGPRAVDHGPISVGVLSTNNDAAASAGIDNGNTFTPRKAYTALIAAWNARGGVAGHRVEPIFFELRSSSSSFSGDLERACTTFTQDHHVAVVLSTTGFFDEAFGQCLARAGTPWLVGDYALGDDQAVAAASTLVAPAALTTDARMTTLLTRFTSTRRLTKDSRIGVVVEGCPFNERTYTRTVVPLARTLGLTIAAHEQTRCFLGISDLGGQATDMQGAVLRMQSEGVTDVVFVSGGVEANLMLLFATTAESQQFHPKYDVTSIAVPVVQEGNTPAAQLRNAVGVGWLPSTDSDRPGATAAGKRCLADLRSGSGLSPAGPTDRSYAYSACDTLALLDAALRASSFSVLQGVHSLGRTFASAMTYGGSTDLAGSRRTGAATGRVFAWQSACSCFDYSGPAFSLVPQESS